MGRMELAEKGLLFISYYRPQARVLLILLEPPTRYARRFQGAAAIAVIMLRAGEPFVGKASESIVMARTS
jgi:hypothetical protein